MSKYTKDRPWISPNGLHVWNESGDVVRVGAGCVLQSQAEALHAFIEAERDKWVNEDEDIFRKGRWTIEDDDVCIYVSHDDIPNEAWEGTHLLEWERGTPDAIRKVGRDFMTWRAAQKSTTLPDPEVGEYIWLERQSGSIHVGQVKSIEDGEIGRFAVLDVLGDGGHYLPSNEGFEDRKALIVAWGLVEPGEEGTLEPDSARASKHCLSCGHQWTGGIDTCPQCQVGAVATYPESGWGVPADGEIPQEPQGLGAVVEVDGVEYVRAVRAGADLPWFDTSEALWRAWGYIWPRGHVTFKWLGAPS